MSQRTQQSERHPRYPHDFIAAGFGSAAQFWHRPAAAAGPLILVQQACFHGIVADYAALFQKQQASKEEACESLKECSKLHFRLAALQGEVKAAKEAKALTSQIVTLEERIKQQNTELAACYKERACIAEQLVKSNMQLQDMRDINEAQVQELAADRERMQALQAKRRELSHQLDEARLATHTQAEELETRLKEKNAAMTKMQRAESITAQLMERLEKDQAGQVERMNQAIQMSEEMVQAASCKAQAIISQAQTEGDRCIARAQEEAILAAAAVPSSPPEGASPGRLSRRLSSLKAQLKRRSSSSANTIPGLFGPISSQETVGLEADHDCSSDLVQPYVSMPTMPARSTSAHCGGCFGLAFTRSGSRVVSCGADKVCRIWEPLTAQQVGELRGSMDTVFDASFTADGSKLLAGGADRALRLWDLSTGRVLHTLTGHAQKVLSLDCNPAETNRAASSSADRSLKLWDLHSGRCVRDFVDVLKTCNSLCFASEGQELMAGYFDGNLRLWDTRSGRVTREVMDLHQREICSVSMGSKGRSALTCGRDNELKVIDMRTFEVRASMRAPGFGIESVWSSVALSPDERYAIAGSSSGSIYIWEVDSPSNPTELQNDLRKVTVENSMLTSELRHSPGQAVQAVAWSPQGSPVVSCNRQGIVTFWKS
ncbi:hypothetical protein WJX74_004988 [Apatococcus lobatus]|uniref:Autophagy-related protein 16 domain-containing protein n=1 Tax=Apatococcus lobatus TaxID=904363 RepID=A0AAW1RWQ5_9CHLO